ncbi:MAG: adenosylmethionine--8-amino-7-oxononanoate transaminase [Bacteroidota bacterium]|nr:adenosylmethionine--8-amino-7-oxononanoate transaminase [Bacteroidota bacterium]
MNKIQKDHQYIWHPFDVIDLQQNEFIKKATGVYLHTNDGRKIIDAISSWWVNIHGHRNPLISKAVSKQLRYLEHVIFAGFTHEPAIKLAESLIKITPGNMSKVFFSDNGSTSVEVALKMSFQYWHNNNNPRQKVVAIEGSYHGDTFGAMSVGARNTFSKPFESLLFDVIYIPFPSNTDEAYWQNVSKIALSNEIAAFIYEPLIQGSAGMRIYEPNVLEKLVNIFQSQQIICIADEVMTGFGRTGKLFASEYIDSQPDIICLSKGITGGYLPLGATLSNAKIYEAFQTKEVEKLFLHGHSYTANPLACAAANESIRLLMRPECMNQITFINQLHKEQIPLFSHLKNVSNVRVLGTILAFEIGDERSYFNKLRDQLYLAFLKRNVLLRPLGNTIYILPPYIITEKQLRYVYRQIEEVISEI